MSGIVRLVAISISLVFELSWSLVLNMYYYALVIKAVHMLLSVGPILCLPELYFSSTLISIV